jgi:hypothetical protein
LFQDPLIAAAAIDQDIALDHIQRARERL